MALETVTLALAGDIPLADFAAALRAFNDLITNITREVAPGGDIDWSVDQLEVSSTNVTALGRSDRPDAVASVVRAYDMVGKRLASGDPVPAYATRPANQLLGLINGRVTSITFETAEADRVIARRADERTDAALAAEWAGGRAFGAVQGRIQTLSSRNGLRFTLYDTVHDKAVSCYLREGQEEMMRGIWGELAIVEGLVRRDAEDGRPRSIRQIHNVSRIGEGGPYDWEKARGALHRRSDDPPAEVRVRQVRDDW